jgi:hypothetical protein
MAEVVFYTFISLLLLLIFLGFFFQSSSPKPQHHQPLTIEHFLPVHHREFEELKHRLAEYDAMLQRIQAGRRDAALAYLGALRNDFMRVQELLNRAAKFLPEVTLEEESERIWVGLKFRFQYRLARLQILLGSVPAVRLKALTSNVCLMANWADKALNEIARQHGLRVLESDLNT